MKILVLFRRLKVDESIRESLINRLWSENETGKLPILVLMPGVDVQLLADRIARTSLVMKPVSP